MTYPPGGPGGYQPPQPPVPPAGAPAPSGAVVAEPGPSQVPFFVNIGVAGLGLLAYLVNFAPTFETELGTSLSSPSLVLWSLLGALVAAVGLVPSVKHTTAPAAVLSVLGLLYVVQSIVSVGESTNYGIGVWFVLLLVLLQAVAAVLSLLFDAGVVTPPAPAPKQEFSPYGAYGAYGAPSAPYGAPVPPAPGYPSPYGAYPGPQGGPAGPGAYPPPPAPQGPPTPPTGYPSFSPPPAVGPAPDAPSAAGPTQQIQTGPPPIPPASGPQPTL